MNYKTVAKYWARRKAQMVKLRAQGWTFPRIAAKFQITPQRVQQIVRDK